MVPNDGLLVVVNCADYAQAEAMARELVRRRLAACGSIGTPVRSIYQWKGELEEAEEVPLTLKTVQARFAELEEAVREMHSYEVPEIVGVPLAAASPPYLAWLQEHAAGPDREG